MVTLHHQNRYNDTETSPITPVGSWTTTDLRLSYTFGSQGTAKSHTVEVAAFCKNLFNRLPPFSADLIDDRGYDAENGDLTGRTCGASLRVAW